MKTTVDAPPDVKRRKNDNRLMSGETWIKKGDFQEGPLGYTLVCRVENKSDYTESYDISGKDIKGTILKSIQAAEERRSKG